MALTLNGYPITDFSGRDPGLPSVIKNGNPERIALYPLAHDDGGAGTLRDQVTLTNATLSGGSTLLAQEKFRNDYQRLTSTFPTLGYRASGAVTNLLYAMNADATSFEGGSTGLWEAGGMTHTNITTDAWHGTHCLAGTITGSGSQFFKRSVTSATSPGTQYTCSLYCKAGNAGAVGGTIRLAFYDTELAYQYGPTVTLTSEWQQISFTATFGAASTTRVLYFWDVVDFDIGDIILIDAVSLVPGATVPMFEEKECVATSATFPTPFTAGEPVSFLFFVWTPWAGDDGVDHYFFDTLKNSHRVMMYKSAAGPHLWMYLACPFPSERYARIAVDSTNWSAGFHIIASSLDETGKPRIALDGVLGSSQSGLGREVELADNMSIGGRLSGTSPLNGLILPFIYRGVAWGDEECEYYSTLQAPPPRTRMVF